jgi:hypothetical protein
MFMGFVALSLYENGEVKTRMSPCWGVLNEMAACMAPMINLVDPSFYA